MPRWLQELFALMLVAAMAALVFVLAPEAATHTDETDALARQGKTSLSGLSDMSSLLQTADTVGVTVPGLPAGSASTAASAAQSAAKLGYWPQVAVGAAAQKSAAAPARAAMSVVSTAPVFTPVLFTVVAGILAASAIVASGPALQRRPLVFVTAVAWRLFAAGLTGAVLMFGLSRAVSTVLSGQGTATEWASSAAIVACCAAAVGIVGAFAYSRVLRATAGVARARPARATVFGRLLPLLVILAGLSLSGLWWLGDGQLSRLPLLYVEVGLLCAAVLARGVFRDVRRLDASEPS